MNKAILISLSPYWYYLIGEGIKKIEVRKTRAKDPNWNKKVECYMTKDKKSFNRIPKEFQEKYKAHFGKVGMQFMCDYVYPINTGISCLADAIDLKMSCLSYKELVNYANCKMLYAWHISQLKIYDKPKELKEFFSTAYQKNCGTCVSLCEYYTHCELKKNRKPLTRPPQSWCYVEEVKQEVRNDRNRG